VDLYVSYDANPPEIALQDTNQQTAAGAHTYSGETLGPEHSTRLIIVAVGYASATAIPSVTVAGVSATKIADVTTLSQHSELWALALPSGTTGDVVLGAGTGTWSSFIAVYSAVYLSSHTATDTSTDTTGDINMSLDVSAYGVVVAMIFVGSFGSPGTADWTGVTEDHESTVPQSLRSTASTTVTSPTTLAIDCTGMSGTTTGAAASFR
jgi:hypothetical protein